MSNLANTTSNSEADLRVVLLGTGCPHPRPDRLGPSVFVEAGGHRLLFDCGRGVTQRLVQQGIPFPRVDRLFVTHLHSDHVVGIPDLWLTGWLFGRELPLRVWGPSGTEAMMGHLAQAYRADIKIRRADEQLPELGAEIVVHDFTEGLIYESDGLKVTPFDVDHGDLIKPALGYRIEYRGRCVVLSGDTRPCENLVRFARQCDVLVHEVAAAPLETLEGEPGSSSSFSADRLRRILGHHTTPEQAGDIFCRVEARLGVYSHIVLFDTITVDDLLSRTRTTYTGPLRVGEDLMVIDVGSAITLHSPP